MRRYQIQRGSWRERPVESPVWPWWRDSILLKVEVRKAFVQFARGEPASRRGFMVELDMPRRSQCSVVMSVGCG